MMKRFMQTAVAAVLLTTSGFSFAANPAANVSPAEKEKIEGVVREYLLSNPEVLVEAMQVLQRKQYEQAQQTIKQTQASASSFTDQLFHTANDPVAGNPNGKITVVEFFDYQCPHCVDMAPVMADAIKANPELRVIFKEFPIRGPMSDVAARAALAANIQGKYYEFSHALLTANQQLTQDSIMQIAKSTGLDVDKLQKDMNDKVVEEQLKANMKLAKSLNLFGTPAFFIGKTDAKGNAQISYVPGQLDQKALQKAIDNASK